MSLLVVVGLAGGLLLLTALAYGAQSSTRGRIDTSREWRCVRGTWAAAFAVGCLVAWFVHDSLELGRGTMLAPAVLGLFVVAGVGLAETVVRPRRPTGVRTASLVPRRAADYLPRVLTAGVAGITVLHLGTLALTTVSASTDDMARAGRQVSARCGDIAGSAGPYPGSFYSVPLALLLVVIGLAAVAALTVVVRRPRGFAPEDVGDAVLRRRSATRIVAAAGAAVAASHVGIAFFAGTALLRMDCQSGWMGPVGLVLVASTIAALLLLAWFLTRIVAPGALPSRPAPSVEAR